MSIVSNLPFEAVELSKSESDAAHEAGRAIATFASRNERLQLSLSRLSGEHMETIVPEQVMQLLARVLDELGDGNPVSLMPANAELTTIQAAKLMRVSRPHLVKLLEAGSIPYRLVGAHRRIAKDDVLTFMENEKKRRKEVLKELIAEQERLGLYE